MKINNEVIKSLRIENGMSLQDVAARLGVSEGTISRYENSKIQRVSPKVLAGYSKLFKVPITALYENPETEWVTALEEAGLQDPRVAGFIEYLEEQAQKDYNSEDIKLSPTEIGIINAYRNADEQIKSIVEYTLKVNTSPNDQEENI